MGGHSTERVEMKEWSSNVTLAFLNILLEKVKQIGDGSLKTSIWREIDKELHEQVGGEPYGIECLKGKYSRLRIAHREFSRLLNHTGVGWDPIKNTVTAPEHVWQEFKKTSKNYGAFKKKGCEHYELLGQIFDKKTATGLMQQTSNQQPLNSDEERELEIRFLRNGVQVKRNISGEGEDEVIETPPKGQVEDVSTSGRHKKRARSGDTDLYACLSELTKTCQLRNEKYKAQIENNDRYSIDAIMEILGGMTNISVDAFNKALAFLVKAEWRNVFALMTDERRRAWLNSL